MEEEKAAAYYDELSRKGEGAARFKQGLGFSSSASARDHAVPARGSSLPSSSSSFLNNFVRASSPSKAAEYQKQAQLQTIQNKLNKKPPSTSSGDKQSSRVSSDWRHRDSVDRGSDRHSRRRSRSRSRDCRGSRHRHRHRSLSRDRDRDKDRDRYRERDKDKDRDRRRRRQSRSPSASDEERGRRRREKSGDDGSKDQGVNKPAKDRNGGIDYAKLIGGYDDMTPAERVKAMMKLQLSEIAEKDAATGMGAGWERFEFNKDAPLDDEDIEAAEDDAVLVKHIGQSFRFSAVEARKEDEIKAAHDEAMFGASSLPAVANTDDEIAEEKSNIQNTESAPSTNLISDELLTLQGGSWRNRARKG
ncbi:DEAD-box ATP-dependent RNA helicase 21 [Diospyros lotus]|uniref:DEAD-box ATP-dependent RNA helicase 21 n=1 Tax=Diospyros lotus TaxID=55363 RepID=UPI00224DBEFC|nr:DEAD-box ATP-dependent RNA helicase 21 [Diospyros lotus]